MKIEYFDELTSFLGGYFHQDWDIEIHESSEAVSLFLNTRPSVVKVNRLVEYFF